MNSVQRFFIGGKNFREEFRRQVRLLIVVTLGFTIAFTWRQTIFDLTEAFVQKFFTDGTSSSALTSVVITLSSLAIIYISSKLLKEKKENY